MRRPWHLLLAPAGVAVLLWWIYPNSWDLSELKARSGSFDEAIRLAESERRARPDDPQLSAQLLVLYDRVGRPGAALSLLQEEAVRRTLSRSERRQLLGLAVAEKKSRVALRLLARVPNLPLDEARELVDMAAAAQDWPTAIRLQRALGARTPSALQDERLVELLLAANQPGEAYRVFRQGSSRLGRSDWLERAVILALWANDLRGALVFQRELARRTPSALHDARLVDLYLRSGQPAAALEVFERRPGADRVAWHREAARLARWAGRSERAAIHLGQVLAAVPHDAEARHMLGQAQSAAGQPDAAWATYAQLLGSPTQPPAAWRAEFLGLSDAARDATPQGLGNLEALIRQQPERLDLRRRLVAAYQSRREGMRALGAQRGLAQRPGSSREDRLVLARLLLAHGASREGLAHLRALDEGPGLPREMLALAADHAARGQLWEEAAYFFRRMAAAEKSLQAYDGLAWVEERRGRLAAAAQALGQAVKADPDHGDRRMRLVDLLIRQQRWQEALAWLRPVDARTSLAELEQRASLANRLGRALDEEQALRELARRKPGDAQGQLRLGELLERRGAVDEADEVYERLVGACPDDREVLYQVAARRFYGGRVARVGELVGRLEALGGDPTRSARLLADYWAGTRPERAARVLDELHARERGDYRTWFLCADLAVRLGDVARARTAWATSLRLNADPPGPDAAEMRAQCLDRLGYTHEAARAWQNVADRYPGRLAPLLALVRHHWDAPNTARYYLERALKLASASIEVRLTQARFLEAQGQDREAAELFWSLREQYPDDGSLYWHEATLRRRLGEHHLAMSLIQQGLRRQPDSSWRALHRAARDDAMNLTRAVAWQEHAGSVDRGGAGLTAAWRFDDAWDLSAHAMQLSWGGVREGGLEVGLGSRWQSGAWRVMGELSAFSLAGVSRPLGEVAIAWEAMGVGAKLRLSEQRWEDSPATLGAGLEHRGEAEVSWRPDPHVVLRGQAALRGLSLAGKDGVGSDVLGELSLRPEADSPFNLAYQFQRRDWGAASAWAGTPAQTQLHSLLLGMSARMDLAHLELVPGYAYEAVSGQGSPMVRGGFWWEPAPTLRFGFQGAYGLHSLNVGDGQQYVYVGMSSNWWF